MEMNKWRKLPTSFPRWQLSGTGWRDNPQINVYNLGASRTPDGVWGATVAGMSFVNSGPAGLRRFAAVLESMADKLERLAEQYPEVARAWEVDQ